MIRFFFEIIWFLFEMIWCDWNHWTPPINGCSHPRKYLTRVRTFCTRYGALQLMRQLSLKLWISNRSFFSWLFFHGCCHLVLRDSYSTAIFRLHLRMQKTQRKRFVLFTKINRFFGIWFFSQKKSIDFLGDAKKLNWFQNRFQNPLKQIDFWKTPNATGIHNLNYIHERIRPQISATGFSTLNVHIS